MAVTATGVDRRRGADEIGRSRQGLKDEMRNQGPLVCVTLIGMSSRSLSDLLPLV
jgi:hypothetical protein